MVAMTLSVKNLGKIKEASIAFDGITLIGELEEKSVLILDEPEVHLHPQLQLDFAELIVLIQKAFNLHVLITTHSPYFLEAIEVYSEKHGISDKCRYYLAEEQEDDTAVIREVTDDTKILYKKFAAPFQRLEDLENEDE